MGKLQRRSSRDQVRSSARPRMMKLLLTQSMVLIAALMSPGTQTLNRTTPRQPATRRRREERARLTRISPSARLFSQSCQVMKMLGHSWLLSTQNSFQHTRKLSSFPWISQPSERSSMMECKSSLCKSVKCKILIDFFRRYKGKDEFKNDVNMIFQNCQVFNEDDSPVGKCGKNMKTFFQKRWTDLTGNWR